MRSLFLKIFLWFVLAMGLVIATLLLSRGDDPAGTPV